MQDAVAAIQSATGNKHVYGYIADLSSFTAIRHLADEIRQQHEKIDTLINNAGDHRNAGWVG